jgi:hypothetical protein
MFKCKMLCALLLCVVSGTAAAEKLTDDTGEWIMGPAFKPDWKPHFTIAATGGYLDPDITGVSGDTSMGVQLSLNCPWFTPPSGAIRQQFNYNTFDNDGQQLKSLEMNPRYFMAASPSILIGFGPGLGYVWTESDLGKNENVWAFQLGADIEFRHEHLYLAIGTRYQFTQNKALGLANEGADNLLTQAKIGINF